MSGQVPQDSARKREVRTGNAEEKKIEEHRVQRATKAQIVDRTPGRTSVGGWGKHLPTRGQGCGFWDLKVRRKQNLRSKCLAKKKKDPITRRKWNQGSRTNQREPRWGKTSHQVPGQTERGRPACTAGGGEGTKGGYNTKGIRKRKVGEGAQGPKTYLTGGVVVCLGGKCKTGVREKNSKKKRVCTAGAPGKAGLGGRLQGVIAWGEKEKTVGRRT